MANNYPEYPVWPGGVIPELDVNKIPEHERMLIGMTLFYEIKKSFQDPAFVAKYEAWKAAKAAKG